MNSRDPANLRKTGWSPCHLVTLSPCLLLLLGCATDFRRNGDPLVGAPPVPAAAPPAALGKPAPAPAPVPLAVATGGSTAAVASGPLRSSNPNALHIGDNNTPLTPARPSLPAVATLTGGSGPPTPLRVASYEQAQALLSSHGVKWQWLEMRADTGEWRFICRVPSKQNPNINRTYEARGISHLAAVQAVLDQMEREGS
jgi:hypothetical protein